MLHGENSIDMFTVDKGGLSMRILKLKSVYNLCKKSMPNLCAKIVERLL